jgi:polyhydroxyalkanoate synthase
MTTGRHDDATTDATAAARLEQNLARVESLSQRLIAALAGKRQVPAALQGPSGALYAKAAAAYWAEMMANPAKLIAQQASYWGETLKHYAAAQEALMQGGPVQPDDPEPKDKRFSNPLWETHPWFSFVKRQYLLNARAIEEAVAEVEGLDPQERRRLEYFSRQIVDMMSPANFLATNPDALECAVKTEGESLVRGLENLVADLERNDGELIVTLADREAFRVGVNLATTPGEVVFRNPMFELIQYAPATERVNEIPLVIFPPWINKFYILDLKPANSLIKWLVDQGFTVFVVSWVNPGPAYRDTTLTDYVEDGYLAAIAEVKAICGTKKVNAVGYCIAGTTLALALGVMRRRKDASVASATFLTTLTDFSDQGEVGVFLDDDFVDGIEAEVKEKGILDSFYMARTFSFLRSNDLIYQPAIRSYMLGESPPAFDLLYWNGDGTNLPAAMAVEYLRGLCQQDRLATRGFDIAGQKVTLADVRVPLFAVACETDHIAAWRSSYQGVRKMGSRERTFVLSGSGHIAGIVNPPARGKYCHWTNPDLPPDPGDWLDGADRHEGSWWPVWVEWLSPRSGRMVAARRPGVGGHPSLCPAPGSYVTTVPGG